MLFSKLSCRLTAELYVTFKAHDASLLSACSSEGMCLCLPIKSNWQLISHETPNQCAELRTHDDHSVNEKGLNAKYTGDEMISIGGPKSTSDLM